MLLELQPLIQDILIQVLNITNVQAINVGLTLISKSDIGYY